MFSRAPGEVGRWPMWNPQTAKSPLLFSRGWGQWSSRHMQDVLQRQSTMECTHWFLKGTPSEGSLIGIRRAQEVQTDKVRFPNVAKYALGLLNTQIPWTLPSEILSPWAQGWVWKSGFIRSFPSGFDDQPILGMVGLIFIVSSCLWPEVAYVQK